MDNFTGIVQRVTFHSPETGWTVIKVSPVDKPHELKTVTLHQATVFAGATMEFTGEWVNHAKYGEQFKATAITEVKPATSAALEKYLGSGLISGVGPKIAKRIVKYFGKDTLEVFENQIERLIEVDGIAKAKLETITSSYMEHREIRNVMLFLQEYGVSTLFAVKIFKTYGNDAIKIVQANPYQLSKDIYGIGFFSADKIALSIGLRKDSPQRIRAAITHVLAASRDQGHCYLELEPILMQIKELLNADYGKLISEEITLMEQKDELKVRVKIKNNLEIKCYYSISLYYDELHTSNIIKSFLKKTVPADNQRIKDWLKRFNEKQKFPLSDEQHRSILGACSHPFSILTGGPGCGKTTTTRTLVKLLLAMKKRVTLAAPTGRAAQRMTEVIGHEALTIHRLLVWQPHTGQFKKNQDEPLETDFVIIDECSMLDISISASLLKAIPITAQILFIGDPNQLPSVGAGNVLKDLIDSGKIPCFHLKKVFRQSRESHIIHFAHKIIQQQIPEIESPIHHPKVWEENIDCLFFDSEEATKDQMHFIKKIRETMKYVIEQEGIAFVREKTADNIADNYKSVTFEDEFYLNNTTEAEIEKIRNEGIRSFIFNIPKEYIHADLNALMKSDNHANALKRIIKSIHPWSSLNYGFVASELVVRLYSKTIKQKLGNNTEVQILSPMTVGSMGTKNLNQLIQENHNPSSTTKPFLEIGGRQLRLGDRVIQRRNNYDLDVFNGDIGNITAINVQDLSLEITFPTEAGARIVHYEKQDLIDIDLAYAITIHKSQGSEFDVVIIPVVLQHFNMLYQNLIYTALTRAKKMAIFVGTRKALAVAIKNIDNRSRKTMLKMIIQN